MLERYRALCDKLSDAERGKLQRSMGMKMEQLKVRCSEASGLVDKNTIHVLSARQHN